LFVRHGLNPPGLVVSTPSRIGDIVRTLSPVLLDVNVTLYEGVFVTREEGTLLSKTYEGYKLKHIFFEEQPALPFSLDMVHGPQVALAQDLIDIFDEKKKRFMSDTLDGKKQRSTKKAVREIVDYSHPIDLGWQSVLSKSGETIETIRCLPSKLAIANRRKALVDLVLMEVKSQYYVPLATDFEGKVLERQIKKFVSGLLFSTK
jgi:hypothetical protein